MPLNIADKNKDYIIKKIGGNAEIKNHIENLGFIVGGTIKIISEIGGNLIVNVKESRIAIDCELAKKIMV